MKLQQRILFSVLGVAVGGVSVGLFRVAALGVDPFQSLTSGLETVFVLTYTLTQNRNSCCGDSGAKTIMGLPNRSKAPAERSGKLCFPANGRSDERS